MQLSLSLRTGLSQVGDRRMRSMAGIDWLAKQVEKKTMYSMMIEDQTTSHGCHAHKVLILAFDPQR